jgi:hypothetical protein
MLMDYPDVPVTVGSSNDFIELKPGEMWPFSRRIHSGRRRYLPDDLSNGDRFRYVFVGGKVDWWDWGSKEEHLKTIVTVPPSISGLVQEPKDNDGRPELMVSGYESPDICFVEEEITELEQTTRPDV